MLELQNKKIAIIEDDVEIRLMLEEFFQSHGMNTTTFENGELFICYYKDNPNSFDIVISDILMPKMDGISMCKIFRSMDIDTPLIMLTSVSEDIDKIIGLEVGADDYIPKPFNIRVLLARVKALLRRAIYQEEVNIDKSKYITYKFGECHLDTSTRSLILRGLKPVEINYALYELLLYFLNNPKIILTRDNILNSMKDHPLYSLDRSIDVKICRLRQILPKNTIKTIRGGGYLFNESVSIISL